MQMLSHLLYKPSVMFSLTFGMLMYKRTLRFQKKLILLRFTLLLQASKCLNAFAYLCPHGWPCQNKKSLAVV
jgi:hypothetical protein